MNKNEIEITNRVLWIDMAKGFGVILVIYGHLLHATNIAGINKIIYSFHVPLFFILSGYVFNFESSRDTKKFIIKKINRLIIPTAILYLFSIPIYFLQIDKLDIVSIIKRISFYDGFIPFNDPLWFFIILFYCYIGMLFLHKIQDINLLFFALHVIFAVAGWIIYSYNFFIPFGLNKGIVCFSFFLLGYYMKQVPPVLNNKKYLKVFVFIIFAFAFLICSLTNDRVSVYSNNYETYWLFIISSISGSYLLCLFFKKLFTNYYKSWYTKKLSLSIRTMP